MSLIVTLLGHGQVLEVLISGHRLSSDENYTSAGNVGRHSWRWLVVVVDVHAGMKGSTYFRGVTHRMDRNELF